MDDNLRLFTSESVTEGHPDKICDQIADAILDTIIAEDESARVACEIAVHTGLVLVMGQITTSCYVDIPRIVRGTLQKIGYTDAILGIDCHSCAVLVSIDEQSPDIAMGVYRQAEGGDLGLSIGAGDQGMVFGYACKETPELMPMPIMLAHKLTSALTDARKTKKLPYLRPDGKSQVTVAYQGDKPLYIDTVVLSAQHEPDVTNERLHADIKQLILNALPKELITDKTKFLINPTGRFCIGGPQGDTGLTGRKIIVDTYGGYCPHGGGAFSGKDPTKVDRSAAYMARYVAKNIVAAGLAERCQLEVAYAIGVPEPVSLTVDTFGTSAYTESQLKQIINKVFDLRPYSIIKALDLRKPIYQKTAAGGHFGREEFSWEKTDKAEELKKAAEEV